MKYEANGKMENDVRKIKGLQDVLGVRAKNVFKVETEEELDAKMADMELVDLQKLAVSSGVSGGGTRMVLKAKIRNEFLKFMRGSHGYSISKSQSLQLKGKNKKDRERNVHQLMTEGLS